MADWPERDELKQVLNVGDDPGNWDLTIDRVLAAAIAGVKADVGSWSETDEPDESLAQAALRRAELIALRPEVAASVGDDPTYKRLLFGHRKRFAIS